MWDLVFDTIVVGLLDLLPPRVQIGCLLVFGIPLIGVLVWLAVR